MIHILYSLLKPFLMKRIRLFIALASAAILLLGACQTKTGRASEPVQATLLWTGEIAADGCGFEVMIDGRKYLPANEDAIDASFKNSDSTEVRLEYVRLQEQIDRRCGMLPQPRIMDAIRIVSIEQL